MKTQDKEQHASHKAELKYGIIASGYQDYIKIMLGDTMIAYIKTTKDDFTFTKQELSHAVDAINLAPTLIKALKSIRGIEAWITPSERHLTAKIYPAIDAFEKTSFGKYIAGNTRAIAAIPARDAAMECAYEICAKFSAVSVGDVLPIISKYIK